MISGGILDFMRGHITPHLINECDQVARWLLPIVNPQLKSVVQDISIEPVRLLQQLEDARDEQTLAALAWLYYEGFDIYDLIEALIGAGRFDLMTKLYPTIDMNPFIYRKLEQINQFTPFDEVEKFVLAMLNSDALNINRSILKDLENISFNYLSALHFVRVIEKFGVTRVCADIILHNVFGDNDKFEQVRSIISVERYNNVVDIMNRSLLAE